MRFSPPLVLVEEEAELASLVHIAPFFAAQLYEALGGNPPDQVISL